MSRRSQSTVGFITIAVIVGLCLLVFSGTAHNLLQPGGPTVQAVFSRTGVLADGSPVRVRGVQVGTVTGMRLNPGDRSTTVEMQIYDQSVLPLYANATATLKWRTVLGENYAIDLARGTPSAGVLNPAVIGVSHTSGQVEVDQILSLLGAQERQGLRSMLSQLPRAFSNPQEPATALSTLANVSPALAAGASDLEGEQFGELHTLVSNASQTVKALNAPRQGLMNLVAGGATTLSTTAADRTQIQGTIGDAAVTLPEVRTTLTQLNTTLAIANPLIARLRHDAPAVAPAVRVLRPTVSEANTLLQNARPLLNSLRPTAAALANLSIHGRPLLQNLTPSLDRVANQILPDLALVYKGSQRATYEMIGPTIADLDAIAASLDTAGHFATLTAGGGSNILDTLPCRTHIGNPDATQLATCENLLSYLEELLNAGEPGGLIPPASTK